MPISIDQLAGGGASERIERELSKIAENVLDPNTKPDATRKLTIEITIKPNEARQLGDAEIVVKSSLAPAKGLPSAFVFDFDRDGKAVMQELKMSREKDQMALADDGSVVDGTGSAPERKVANMSMYR